MAGGDGDRDAVSGCTATSSAAFSGAVPSHTAGGGNGTVAVATGGGMAGGDGGALVGRHVALSMVTEHYAKGGLRQEPYRPGSTVPTTLRQAKGAARWPAFR